MRMRKNPACIISLKFDLRFRRIQSSEANTVTRSYSGKMELHYIIYHNVQM